MVGKTLGHYEILEPLGAGGMGEVYLGEDTRLGRVYEALGDLDKAEGFRSNQVTSRVQRSR